MKIKSQLSMALAAAASIPLLMVPAASAQDINFSCSGGAHLMLEGSGTDYCTAGSIPDNKVLNYYSPDGLVVTNNTNGTTSFAYNDYQGDTSLGTAPISAPGGPPSLSGGSVTGGGAVDSVTVNDPGTTFEFNSVDLFNSSGTMTYTITGYNGAVNPGDVVYTISGSLASGLTDYTTIGNGGNNEYVTNLVIQLSETGTNTLDRLDHIEVTAPEGGAALLYLLLAGGTCLGAMASKTRLGLSI
jgi:uncharacterized protein YraI